MRIFIISCIILGFTLNYSAQNSATTEEQYLKEYDMNIKKTHLNGVYIPVSIEDAMNELQELSDELTMQKFAQAPIDDVAEKLHFGIGRWMMVNWQFYTGSRISHLMKEKGVLTPDAMAQYLIRHLHAHLNNTVPNEAELIKIVNERHEEEMKKKREDDKVIKTEVRKIPKPDKN